MRKSPVTLSDETKLIIYHRYTLYKANIPKRLCSDYNIAKSTLRNVVDEMKEKEYEQGR